MNRLWGIRLAALLAFVGCADERLAGKGAASETTNGIVLEGRLFGPDGSAAARVAVALSAPETDSVYSLDLTDDSGAYSLLAPRPGRFVVRTATESLGISSWLSVGSTGRQAVEPLKQAKLRRLSGRVVLHGNGLPSPAVLVVRVPGMRGVVRVRQNLTWVFDSVPEGWHLVRVVDSSGRVLGEAMASTYDQISLDSTGGCVVSVSERTATVLDDFEADEGQGRLAKILDGAWWGRWNDTSALYDSARTWAGTTGLTTAESAWSGKSLNAQMLVGSAIPTHPELNRSAGLQLKIGGREDLDSQSVWYDLSRIDSIVFMAKGNSTMELHLVARSKTDISRKGNLRVEFQPTGQWQRFSFATGRFQADPDLAASAVQIRELRWIVRKSARFWLDDIELVGVHPSQLLRR
jgi:hypothetical protein